MSISDLNHFMTYVIEGWMLFSAGFIGTTFVSFVSRRIQEDLEAAALAEGVSQDVIDSANIEASVAANIEASVAEAVEAAVIEGVGDPAIASASTPTPTVPPAASPESSPGSESPPGQDGDEQFADEVGFDPVALEAEEAARLEEVAAISEQLAKNRGKQSDSSSVSVST